MADGLPAVAPDWEAIERLLDRAIELPPDEQDALLARAGSDDPALAAAVKRLVDAGRRAGTFLEQPAASYAGPLLAWVAGREPLEPGATLGPYEIVRRLGRGATATVFLARDPKHRRSVAVKVLHPDLAAAVGAERFLREIEIAATLQHPHILPLFDSGAVDGLLYYVMPHVEGESLRQMLSSRHRLPLATALRIAGEVAGALDYSHRRGVVHRDIKPENILLQDGQAIVADFGIARALDAAGPATGGEPTFGTGTPAYMSPEQSRSGAVDGRSDLYSLGCVVYEMLAGQAPFDGSPREVRQRHLTEAPPPLPHELAPEPVARAVARALAKSPDRPVRHRGRVRRGAARGCGPSPAPRATAAVACRRSGGGGRRRGARGDRAAVPRARRRSRGLPYRGAAFRPGHDGLGAGSRRRGRCGDGERHARPAGRDHDRGPLRDPDPDGGRAPVRSVEDALALGRRFGAGSVLTGTVARAGDDLRIEATLFRSDRPVPVARATVVAPAESLAVLTDSLTLQLVRQVWLRRGAPTPSLAAVTTRSVAALRSFLDGERAVLAARWREACDDYRAAFDADTGFTLAYARYAEAVTWRRDEHVNDVEPEVRRHLRAGRLRLA